MQIIHQPRLTPAKLAPLDEKKMEQEDRLLAVASKYLMENNFDFAFQVLIFLADKGNRNAHQAMHSLFNPDDEFFTQKYNSFHEQAREMQSPIAFNLLGDLHSEGVLVPKDLTTAFDFWEKAANLKHPDATFKVGCAYYNGAGLHIDDSKAHEYFIKAVKLGVPEAFFKLAETYSEGIGTEQDDYLAQKYFRVALSLGIGEAEDYIIPDEHSTGISSRAENNRS